MHLNAKFKLVFAHWVNLRSHIQSLLLRKVIGYWGASITDKHFLKNINGKEL